jgi:ribonuclease-3
MTVLGRRKAGPLEEGLGYRFRQLELLTVAVTHRSAANEQGLDAHYERMEFLGDAVLGLVTAEWLFARYPDKPEGELSRLKSSLVSARSLAGYARQLALGQELHLGIGEERSGGRQKRSLLADSLEAIFGAVFLDGGLEAARRVVVRFLEDRADANQEEGARDPKTALQELTQARGWDLPDYVLVDTTGPDHDKRFVVECQVRGEAVARGEGRSKKIAEQAAASQALAALAS